MGDEVVTGTAPGALCLCPLLPRSPGPPECQSRAQGARGLKALQAYMGQGGARERVRAGSLAWVTLVVDRVSVHPWKPTEHAAPRVTPAVGHRPG